MKRMILVGLLALAPAAALAGPDTGHYPYRVGQPVYAQPFHDDGYAPPMDEAYAFEAFGANHEGGYAPDPYADGYAPELYADGYGEPYDPALDAYGPAYEDGDEAYAAPPEVEYAGDSYADHPYAGEGWYEGVDAHGPYSGRYQWRRSAPHHDPAMAPADNPYAAGPDECWDGAGGPC